MGCIRPTRALPHSYYIHIYLTATTNLFLPMYLSLFSFCSFWFAYFQQYIIKPNSNITEIRNNKQTSQQQQQPTTVLCNRMSSTIYRFVHRCISLIKREILCVYSHGDCFNGIIREKKWRWFPVQNNRVIPCFICVCSPFWQEFVNRRIIRFDVYIVLIRENSTRLL